MRIKRKAVYDADAERDKWREHFRDRYMNLFLSKWEIEGTSEEENRFILRTLYLKGAVAAWRAADDLLVFSPFAPHGFNIYDTPLQAMPINVRGATFFPTKDLSTYALRNNEARGVDEPEIVLGWALPNKKSIFSQIEALIEERVDVAMLKSTNRIGCKIPVILMTTPENRKALEDFASDVLGDNPIAKIGVTEAGSVTGLQTGIPYLLDKLETYDQNVDGKILTTLGIDNSGARKMEREVVDEVNANNSLINVCGEMFASEARKFLDKCNEAFGSNLALKDKTPTVDSFHDPEDKKEDMTEDPQDEIRE